MTLTFTTDNGVEKNSEINLNVLAILYYEENNFLTCSF